MNKAFPNTTQDFGFSISDSGYYYANKMYKGFCVHSKEVDLISYPVDVFIDDFLDNIIELLKDEPKQLVSTEHTVQDKSWDWRGNTPLIVALVWITTYLVRLLFNPDITAWFISVFAFGLCIVMGILCKKLFR